MFHMSVLETSVSTVLLHCLENNRKYRQSFTSTIRKNLFYKYRTVVFEAEGYGCRYVLLV